MVNANLDCNVYVVKIDLISRSVQLSVSSYASWITTWSWRCPTLSFAVLCSHRFKIIDYLSLSRIPFQGLPLLGHLHSVDITRRIGSLICSSLTLNVIHSGQVEAWTFFERETLLTKSFNQATQKTAHEGSACKAQPQQHAVEHSGNSNVRTRHCLG